MLRPWRDSDRKAYQRILNDPRTLQLWGAGLVYRAKRAAAGVLGRFSTLEARRALRQIDRHWQRFGYGMWAAEEHATHALVGSIGYSRLEAWTADPSDVEIGWLLDPAAWGRGFATEGARACLDYGFDKLALRRVVNVMLAQNLRSQRVAERLGLPQQGRTRWIGADVVWYAIEREAWREARSRASSRDSR